MRAFRSFRFGKYNNSSSSSKINHVDLAGRSVGALPGMGCYGISGDCPSTARDDGESARGSMRDPTVQHRDGPERSWCHSSYHWCNVPFPPSTPYGSGWPEMLHFAEAARLVVHYLVWWKEFLILLGERIASYLITNHCYLISPNRLESPSPEPGTLVYQPVAFVEVDDVSHSSFFLQNHQLTGGCIL